MRNQLEGSIMVISKEEVIFVCGPIHHPTGAIKTSKAVSFEWAQLLCKVLRF